MSDDALIAQLIELEQERCAAISCDDRAKVDALTGDTLTYTHSTAQTEDRGADLASIGSYERRLTRDDDLTVRVYGDAPIMTGTIDVDFPKAGRGETPGRLRCRCPTGVGSVRAELEAGRVCVVRAAPRRSAAEEPVTELRLAPHLTLRPGQRGRAAPRLSLRRTDHDARNEH